MPPAGPDELPEEEERKVIPAPPSAAGSFLQRLRGRYGAVDPEISLQEDSTPPAGDAAGDRGATAELVLKLSAKDHHACRFQIKGEVARGGMGAILRVWDDDLRRNLAMKVLLSRRAEDELGEGPVSFERELLSRFLEEAQITGQLDHPGIVPVHDLGIDERGRVFFTMRLVRGRDLKQILDLLATGAEGWTLTKALHVVLKVCEAMAFAHSKGVVHRDLKPANVMVGRFGETYVMDWGLARVLGRRDSRDLRIQPADASALSLVRTARQADQKGDPQSPLVTMDGDVIGTPSYMSPEQAEGRLEDVGPRSDVYSLGAILYQILTGRAPYVKPGATLTPHVVLSRVLDGPPEPIRKLAPDVPDELAAICDKAMERDPERRYAGMLELAADIEAFLEGRVVGAYEAGPLAEARKWVHRNRVLAATITLALLLALGGIAGVIAVQTVKARELQGANQDLADAKAIAEQKERDALAASEVARSAARDAEAARVREEESAEAAVESERVARAKSYMSDIRAADFSLRLREVGEASALLERCDADLRDWEWSHLALACDGQLGDPVYPNTRVARIAIAPAAGRALVLTENGLMRAYRVTCAGLVEQDAVHKELWPLAIPPHADLDLDPSGEVVAVVGRRRDRVVLLSAEGLDAPDVDPRGLFPPAELEPGDGGWLPPDGTVMPEVAGASPTRAVFAPADDLIAVGYENGVVLVFDHVARTLARALVPEPAAGPVGAVHALAWDATAERLAVGTEDGVLRLYDAADGALLLALPGHEGAVLAAAFSADGERFATGSADGRVRAWDAETGRLVARHGGHVGPVRALAFEPRGDLLVSGGDDATLQVWDAREEERRLAAGVDRPVEVGVLFGHEGALRSIAFVPDGEMMVSGGDGRSVRAWDPEFFGPVSELVGPRFTDLDAERRMPQVTAVAFQEEGPLCLTGHADGTIAIWDSLSGELYDVLRGHKLLVASATWSEDGTRILSASFDKTAILWDVATGREIAVFGARGGHRREVRQAALSPDGSFVVTASGDQTARVWDVRGGEQRLVLEGHDGWVNAVAITPDGKRVWTGGGDSTLRLWDAQTGAELLAQDVGAEVGALALSEQGDLLLAGLGDGRLVALDASALEGDGGAPGRKEIFTREVVPAEERVTALAINPQGTRIVVGASDGVLRLLHARTGDALLSLRGHSGVISGVSFDGDGTRLLSGSSDLSGDAVDVQPGERVARVWETERSAGRREARRAAEQTRRKVAPVVASLFSTHFRLDRVLEAIDRHPFLLPEERPAAKRVARVRGDDARLLALESWRVVVAPGARPEEYERAAARAEAAAEIGNGSHFCETVLGAAQVRAGRLPAALTTLRAVDAKSPEEIWHEVARVAFEALAHQGLGHDEEARAAVRRLDTLANGRLEPALARLVDEARAAAGALRGEAAGEGGDGGAASAGG